MSAADYYWVRWGTSAGGTSAGGTSKRYYVASTGSTIAKAKIPENVFTPHIRTVTHLTGQGVGRHHSRTESTHRPLTLVRRHHTTVNDNIAKKEGELQALLNKFHKFPEAVQTTVSLDFDPNQYHFKPPTVKKEKKREECKWAGRNVRQNFANSTPSFILY